MHWVLAQTDTLFTVGAFVLYLLLGLVAIAIIVGVPAYVGFFVYQTARDKDMFNPAAFAFIAAFFSLLLLMFLAFAVVMFSG